MKIVRPHNKTRQAARDTAESLVPTLIQRFGEAVSDPRTKWEGDVMTFSFSARGFDIKGTLEVADTDFQLDIKLPFAAKFFEGTIRSKAEQAIDQYLSGELTA